MDEPSQEHRSVAGGCRLVARRSAVRSAEPGGGPQEAVATAKPAASRRARRDRVDASDTAAITGFEAARASSHGQDGRPRYTPSATARSNRPAQHPGGGVDAGEARGASGGQCARQPRHEADSGHRHNRRVTLIRVDRQVHRFSWPRGLLKPRTYPLAGPDRDDLLATGLLSDGSGCVAAVEVRIGRSVRQGRTGRPHRRCRAAPPRLLVPARVRCSVSSGERDCGGVVAQMSNDWRE
jgi:hypothetical protein